MISTRQAAKKLGLSAMALSRYIAKGKIPAPQVVNVAGMSIHSWSEAEIEYIRQLLPKIANGRKTRHKKLRKKDAQPRAPQPQHAKTARAGGPKAVPHKSRKSKRK
jgi:predicted DNA-binding transcriptional regulator AlpA